MQMLLQSPPQMTRARLGGGRAGLRIPRIGPEASLRQQALVQDVPGWAEGGTPVMEGRQRLLEVGGNAGIRSEPASEEVERFEEGGNGGIRSGPASEETGGESWPMRFVRGGQPTFPVGNRMYGGEMPLEEGLGRSNWRMSGMGEVPVSDRLNRGTVQMGGTGWDQVGEGGIENGAGLPIWGDYAYGEPEPEPEGYW